MIENGVEDTESACHRLHGCRFPPTKSMAIEAVVFDLGGVFYPWPAPEYFGAWERRLGRSAGTLEALLWHGPDIEAANVGRLTAAEYISRTARRLDADESLVRELIEHAFAAESVNRELVSYTRLLRNRLRIGAVTNTWTFGRRLAEERGIADLFEVFVSSAEEGVRKPDPAIFQALLPRLELQPSRVALVDDSMENVEAARSLGFHAILFESTTGCIQSLDRCLGAGPAPSG